ncbi:methyltransferase domain-containing protein [Siccirubricoccus sp. KC 17139]|uniref:Methyltransferase domain-containing protein n=1 Tax=Siccirubricoccus soli TaxID=2899147 RepID=A0ABT1D579_9PROT|nr:methyltransferase domain-containing protein [Siccirubricoccus soli]MCO6417081.1 methyltransferase domain-containing protein [Siccirubricoccus soli]MCP2683216.1 methyltransferase domain-containing protein [Siccirubricoccus soli]
MRRRHFEAFHPLCPHCLRSGAGEWHLVLAHVMAEQDDDILSGILQCANPGCLHEYPILGGIPLIVPELRRTLGERAVELLLRDDLDPLLESLLGDAVGPDSWFDSIRLTASTYGWDGYADLDPTEEVVPQGPQPGAVRRCLARLLELSPGATGGLVIDTGCGAGRTSFDLAERHPDALVLGCDVNLGMLRLARRAGEGRMRYPRRRIGLVYDRREFALCLPGAERVDFWACDATSLPFAPGRAGLVAALNLFDCVPDPRQLLAALAAHLAPGGSLLLATPYDWATRATPVTAWVGGHSQRGGTAGAAEPLLRALIAAQPGLTIRGEDPGFPWQTRLHDRSAVAYRAHLLAAVKQP